MPIPTPSRPLLAALLLLTAPTLSAQPTPKGATLPDAPPAPALAAALQAIRATNAWTLEQQVSICEIPAPPFKEQARAAEFRRRLIALGYPDARIDAEGNVIAEAVGTRPGPTVMLAGHLDTVFPEGTDVRVTRDGTRYTAPGIGDDCRGLVVVLAVARAIREHRLDLPGRLLLVGNVGEEGPGNLRGVRHLFTREFPGKIDHFISVDGTGGDITSRAVGSIRYRVTFAGPGGHSYGAFGMPNPIHALGRAIAAISEVRVPTSPKTTFNVGIVEGGTSVNTISASAAMDVDMRSESREALAAVDAQVLAAVRQARDAEAARWPRSSKPLTVRIDTIGIRPLGTQGDDAPIVAAALRTGRAVGLNPSTTATSTDANLPMSLGIPAITIDGGGDGGGSHSLSEWYDDGVDGWKGPQWALLLVATLLGAGR